MALLSTNALKGQIKSVKGNATKLRDQIQTILYSCAYQAAMGNANYFNDLLDAVGTGTRIKGLTAWAEVYGFVRIKDEKFVINKTMRKEANVIDEASFAQHLEVMLASPKWFEIVPKEKAKSIFDPSHYLSGVLTKLNNESCGDIVPYLEKAIEEYNKAQAIKSLLQSEVQAA